MKNHLMGTALAGLMLLAAPAFAQAPSAAITAAVADAGRPDADKANDANRKPADMLAFAGVAPGMKVAELNPGAGYFTRIFAKTVGANGKVYTYAPPPRNPPPAGAVPISQTYTNVSPIQGVTADFAVPEPVDVVWTSRNYHDFRNALGDQGIVAFNRKVFAALKPGGTYIVLDHAAAEDAPADVGSKLHRIKESTVRADVEAAGFRFVGGSNAVRYASDDKTKPVFEGDVRGRTDQFVLKFQKP
jgi:predicted methyltransferase